MKCSRRNRNTMIKDEILIINSTTTIKNEILNISIRIITLKIKIVFINLVYRQFETIVFHV